MLEQHGLAASAGSHDGGDPAAQAIEIDALQDLLGAEAMAQIAHFDRNWSQLSQPSLFRFVQQPPSCVIFTDNVRSKFSRSADSIGEST